MKSEDKESFSLSFAMTDHVLLLFNEHDTRIALNWEFSAPVPACQNPDYDRNLNLPIVK